MKMVGNGKVLSLDETELSGENGEWWKDEENVQTAPFYNLASAILDAGRIHLDADASKLNCHQIESGLLIPSDAGRIQSDAHASGDSWQDEL